MSIEEKLHKKMVKIMLGGVVKLETPQKEKKGMLSNLKDCIKLRIKRIQAFFQSGIDEMQRDMWKTKRSKKTK